MRNNSEPPGVIDWFQGNDAVFPAHEGPPTAYIAANFNNTSGTGTISNWLLTPVVDMFNGQQMSFWTRTVAGSIYPDRLQVRASTAGESTNVGTTSQSVGDFTTLLLDINENYQQGGYPEVWTQYTVTMSGVSGTPTGRFALRYFVENGGPSGANSNYIGVDTGCADPGGPPPPPPPRTTSASPPPATTATSASHLRLHPPPPSASASTATATATTSSATTR